MSIILAFWATFNLWLLIGMFVLYLIKYRSYNAFQILGACILWPIVLMRDKLR